VITPAAVITRVGTIDDHSTALSSASQAYDNQVAQKNRTIESKPIPLVPVMPLAMQHRNTSTVAPEATAFFANGFELAFGERVGKITPAPSDIIDADPEYSNRSLDLSYRVLDGQIGVGGRLTYGTYSSISYGGPDTLKDVGLFFAPQLEAKKGLTVEFFINYRLPLWDHLALAAEASLTGSTTYYKAGGDLFLLWFVTDHIGIQAGGGYGQYRYDLREQRSQIEDDNTNEHISGEDFYQGSMVQGRYGLIYRF
jgi:hypothetical protein